MQQTRTKQIHSVLFILAFFCLVSGGCVKKQKLPDGMPAPQPTVITIIQDGKPLEGASIALLPSDTSNSWNAGAATDSTGKAAPKTLNKYDGVVPGKYRILVTKRISDESKFTPPDPDADPEAYAKYMQESMGEKVASYDLIDPKFGKITDNTETIDVVTGKNEKTIDVGTAVKQQRRQ